MKLRREYLPENLEIKEWKSVQPFFEELLKREIKSVDDLKKWLKNRSELESVLQEDLAWRYIKMNCNTQDESLAKQFEHFVTEIEPKTSELGFELNKMLCNNPYLEELKGEEYEILVRLAKKEIELFRQENIAIQAELQTEEREYGRIASEMTIKYNDEEMTMQKASNFLKDINPKIREQVYRLMWERRLQDTEKLDNLLNRLIEKRNKLASNAGFDNFRDYMFVKLGRFDYEVDDCYRFHQSVKEEVVPMVEELQKIRKNLLKVNQLKPWDLDVDENLKAPLKPFSKSGDLISKTIACFSKVRPEFADFIKMMDKGSFLDLDSRKGKAPGGFNYPLHESNIPFIFMNATGNLRDVETMVHEGGHAIHSFLSKDLELSAFKDTPSEVAELASMSMELISMEHWDSFFENAAELKRAKLSQLKGIIEILPWVAMIDKFQHELYLNKDISAESRKKIWRKLSLDFSGNVVDWTGLDQYRDYGWQKQLHIFEVPFYYIEYGFAQLGAIAIWRNYKLNPEKAIQDYCNALKLGYTRSIPQIYKTAGVEFNFTREYIRELMLFVKAEIEKLYHE